VTVGKLFQSQISVFTDIHATDNSVRVVLQQLGSRVPILMGH